LKALRRNRALTSTGIPPPRYRGIVLDISIAEIIEEDLAGPGTAAKGQDAQDHSEQASWG
jgi:hypothetical protein